MIEPFWRVVAKTLSVNGPFGSFPAHFLANMASKTPHSHLNGYMGRWWLIAPCSWLPFSIRFHHIIRPDREPCMHDHPWNFRSFILDGWYLEASLQDGKYVYVCRTAGTTYRRSARQFHRIIDTSPGGVWTLVICGRKTKPWGFLTKDLSQEASGSAEVAP